MFNPRLIRSALWLAGAGAALGGLLLWAGPDKVTPVSVLVVLAWVLASQQRRSDTEHKPALVVADKLAVRRAGWHVSGRSVCTRCRAAHGESCIEIVDHVPGCNCVLMAAGTWGGWRSCSARVGALVAMAGSVIGSTISLAVYIPLFFATILRNDPDPGEALVVPAILMAVAAVVGTVGGMFGKGAVGLLVGRTPIVDAR